MVATLGWLVLTRTAFYGHLRLMGADERAAYSSGVRIGVVRIGAHIVAGVYVGLAALTFTSLISSGDPTQGSTYTLMAVTALVLGGTSLAGGRGGVVGSLLGAVNVYLITYVLATFNFGMVQSFVTRLAYGVILVLSLLLSLALPRLQGRLKGLSPLLFFLLLALVASAVVIHARFDYTSPQATEVETPATPGTDAKSTSVFMFEGEASDAVPGERPALVKYLAYGGILALFFLILLRIAVAQGEKKNVATPVFIVTIAVMLLGVYLVARDRDAAATGAPDPAVTTTLAPAALPAPEPGAAP